MSNSSTQRERSRLFSSPPCGRTYWHTEVRGPRPAPPETVHPQLCTTTVHTPSVLCHPSSGLDIHRVSTEALG
jgi:hypothetical protein